MAKRTVSENSRGDITEAWGIGGEQLEKERQRSKAQKWAYLDYTLRGFRPRLWLIQLEASHCSNCIDIQPFIFDHPPSEDFDSSGRTLRAMAISKTIFIHRQKRLLTHFAAVSPSTEDEYPAKATLRSLQAANPVPSLPLDFIDPASMSGDTATKHAVSILSKFNTSLAANDAAGLASCFFPTQAWWKDRLALTYHLRTLKFRSSHC